jgi:coenzyme F420-reducing hydrogenase beta subunit
MINQVIKNGYCIGCGACASVKDYPISIELKNDGMYQANIKSLNDLSSQDTAINKVCPFSDSSLNEDQIGQKLFADECQYDSKIGYYLQIFAGYVTEGEFRAKGSSGGIGTWVLNRLLEKKLIDYVIHIHSQSPTENDPRLFKYGVSSTINQVMAGAKTRYYPVEMSEVLKIVREQPGRYAIIGVPCFIKAVRLLMLEDEIFYERIKFCIGLICGHLKSTQFAEMFAWQLGIEPKTIEKIDFRKKLPATSASAYGVEVTGKQNDQLTAKTSPPVNEMFGTNWGLGFFKYKACDYCDDITAETADLTVGDAWLPQYAKDHKGTNVVVVRNQILAEILREGVQEQSMHLDSITLRDVIQSQDANYRHRRTGLAYRLYLAEKKGEWHPPKRVKPSGFMLPWIKKRFILRVELAQKSHLFFQEALVSDSFSHFVEKITPLIESYQKTYKPPLWYRILVKLKRLLQVIARG